MNARDLALMMLDPIKLPGMPQNALPRRVRWVSPDDSRDLELAARIETEVIEHLLWINHLIEHFADRPLGKIDPLVRRILAVALSQILYLDRIPPSAAVDEAVEQAKRFGKKSAAGFVNAVLRRATREPLPDVPSAEENPLEHARLALSHPPELFERLQRVFGPEQALQLCRHNNRRPPTVLRLGPGVSIDQLKTDTASLIPHERPGMAVIQPTPINDLIQWSVRGLAQAQDPTAAQVAAFCDIRPGQNVLDRCCGLGTKTVQLQQMLEDHGMLIAIDANPMRVDALAALARARGWENLHAIYGKRVEDAEPWVPENGFDRILLDAPCSNSGVLSRRSQARYFQDSTSLESLRRIQIDIVGNTLPTVARGGLLIYSTCSIWPEENEQMVAALLKKAPDFKLLHEQTTLPSFDTDDLTRYHDGGYVAVIQRT